MLIGVCGLGYSGSGAVLDLLKEYDEINVIDGFEFCITYFPDGLLDLYRHLGPAYARFYDGDAAIKRFLALTKKMSQTRQYKHIFNNRFYSISEKYVEKLVEIKWKGFWGFNWYHADVFELNWFFRLGIRLNKLLGKRVFKYNQHMYLPVCIERFLNATKDYVREMISLLTDDKEKSIVLNQCFPGNAPQLCFPFFDDPKAIVVVRDPRDIYILAKCIVGDDAAWIPTDNVDNFIVFYRSQYKKLDESQDILTIMFEDLIYYYDDTVRNIEAFLGIHHHVSAGKFFDPQISKNNTQLFNRILGYSEDIRRIESELTEYLYNFQSFKEMDVNIKPF